MVYKPGKFGVNFWVAVAVKLNFIQTFPVCRKRWKQEWGCERANWRTDETCYTIT